MIRFYPPEDLQRAGLVARVYALRDIALDQLVVSRVGRFEENHERVATAMIETEDSASVALSDDASLADIEVSFRVAARSADEDVVSVTGRVALRYARQIEAPAVSAEDVAIFASINGVYNAWPYIRELASSSFARLGYPPLTLGPLVISPRTEEDKATSKHEE